MKKEQIIFFIIIAILIIINLNYWRYYKSNKVLTNNDILYAENISEELYIVPEVIIKESKLGGRGVFSKKNYKKNDIIEICPAILTNKNIINGRTRDYIFSHPKDDNKCLIGFGYGSIYNHKDQPNATWNVINEKQIKITALKDILPDEEITVSYGDSYWKTRNYSKN